MYIDKMIEYLVLAGILKKNWDINQYRELKRKYNVDKMKERRNELEREFLEPYAINSDSKE